MVWNRLFCILSVTVIALPLLFCGGCVSPLQSSDSTTRLEAVNNVSNEDALFFIAMDIGVGLKGKWPEFYSETHLRNGEYAEDVRVAAVKRISDPTKLLRLASWPDGDIYRARDIEQSRFVYDGETYYVHDAESCLQHAVHQGDAVRAAALERLCRSECFESVVNLLGAFQDDNHGGSEARTIRGTLFPGKERYSVGDKENSFVDYYAGVKKDNPLDRVLKAVVERQTDQRLICAFVASSREYGPSVYPVAVETALAKIDGSNAIAAHNAFRSLTVSESGKTFLLPTMWIWKLLDRINDPTTEELICAAKIGYGKDSKISDSDKRMIDAIALKRFDSDTWAECYLNDYFVGFPKGQMLKNMTDSEAAARFLIKARKIGVDDVSSAFSTVTNAMILVRIEKDCYLKIVAEKARSLHFDLTYADQLNRIAAMTERIPRAIAANSYKEELEKSTVPPQKKAKLAPLMDKWINAGVEQILAEGNKKAKNTFVLCGFYAGMPEFWANLIYKARYANEEINWTVGSDGMVVRINFGTTFLAKQYQYDVQTWGEWIKCFSKESGRRFVERVLKDEKKPIGGRETVVRVSQQTWRNQDNRGNVTLIYFGDKKVREIEPESTGFVESVFKIARGVTGGDVMKEVVLEGARHWANKGWESGIGGYPGTLRVELGTVCPGGTRTIRQTDGKSSVERSIDSIKDTWDAMKDAAPAVEGFLNNVFN